MAFNTATTTNKNPLWVELRDGKAIKLDVMVATRAEAEVGMTPLTFKRFRFACDVLAAGVEWDSYAKAFDDAEFTPNEWGEHELNEARVTMYVLGKGIPVYTPNGIVYRGSNIFTELTSIQDYVRLLRMTAMEDGEMLDIGNEHKPEQAEQHEDPFPKDRVVPQSPAAPSPQQQPAPPTPTVSAPPDGIIDLGNYDYNQRANYEAQYIGKNVCFNVSKVFRKFKTKKDGSGTYECVDVLGYYDDLPSDDEHPIYDFTVVRPKEDRNFGDWKTIMKLLGHELTEPGKSFAQPMRFYYKLAKSKNAQDDRVFWNLRKIEFLGAPTPQAPAEKEKKGGYPAMDEPDGGMGYSGYDGDVPF